jgi:hypothetical protein
VSEVCQIPLKPRSNSEVYRDAPRHIVVAGSC